MLPVVYSPIAEKYFKKLKDKQLKNLFKKAILSIRMNPQIGYAKSGDLRGIYTASIFIIIIRITSLHIKYRSLKTEMY